MRDRQRVQRCTLRGLPVSPSPGRLPPKCDAGGDSRRCDLMSHPEGRGRALPDNARPPCFRGVRGFPTLGMLAHGGIKVSGMRDRPGACNGTGRPGRGPGSSAAVRTQPPVGRDLCNHVPVSSHAGWLKTSTCTDRLLHHHRVCYSRTAESSLAQRPWGRSEWPRPVTVRPGGRPSTRSTAPRSHTIGGFFLVRGKVSIWGRGKVY